MIAFRTYADKSGTTLIMPFFTFTMISTFTFFLHFITLFWHLEKLPSWLILSLKRKGKCDCKIYHNIIYSIG